MRGIFIESLRGAIVRILRMIIYVIIVVLLIYVIGLLSSKKYEETKGRVINASQIEEIF